MDHARFMLTRGAGRTDATPTRAAAYALLGAVPLLWLAACGGSPSPAAHETSWSRFVPQPRPAAAVARLQIDAIDKIDVLFVVDNSDSMGEEQEKLAQQVPLFASALATGDVDADGVPDFPPPLDVQFGVVSTDMGASVEGIANCQGLGDDAVLGAGRHKVLAECPTAPPTFIHYEASQDNVDGLTRDFTCLATLGTGGCGYEQSLEAGLKALWPSADERVLFHGATADSTTEGHGDTVNAGFSRSSPGTPSLLVIVLLSDEDDCSAADESIFTPPMYLDPNDARVQVGMNVRCAAEADRLYPVERYLNGLRLLREGAEQLVVFAAITGVPPDRVDAHAMAAFDYTNAKARDAFYGHLLADKRMQVTIDSWGTPDVSDDKVRHVCQTAQGTADPARRITQLARGFGENGMVQSICQDNYESTVRFILGRIAERMRNPH